MKNATRFLQFGIAALCISCNPKAGEPPPVAAPTPPSHFEGLTEETWLVRETLLTLRGLTDLAQGRTRPTGEAPLILVTKIEDGNARYASFRVTVDAETPFDLRFGTSIQDPAVYAERAATWLATSTTNPSVSGQALSGQALDEKAIDLAAILLDPTPENLHRAALAASSALQHGPRSAEAHEGAAAVLGVVGLRESAAGHSDVRRILTRVTGHLAMARLGRSERAKSDSGILAWFAHAFLSGRKAEAYAYGVSFNQQAEPGRAWRNVAQLLSAGDWRNLGIEQLPSFMEQLAFVRALHSGVRSDRIHSVLEQIRPDWQTRPDWARTMLSGGVSVQTCNVFAKDAWAPELDEAVVAAKVFLGETIDPMQTAGWHRMLALFAADVSSYEIHGAQGRASVDILPWPLLGNGYQRHIGAGQSYELHCLKNMLGLEAEVPAALAKQEKSFHLMPLFALEGQRWAATAPEHARLAATAARFVRERPDLVTPHLWMRLFEPQIFAKAPGGAPDPYKWFQPPQPFGLKLADESRVYGIDGDRDLPQAEYDALNRVDPFDTEMRWRQTELQYGPEPPPDVAQRGLGPALFWTASALYRMEDLEKNTPAEHRLWATRMCDLDVDDCVTLAELERAAGHEAAAERAYMKLWKEAADRVLASRHVDWLVKRLSRTGRLGAAFEIAEGAAAVYSYMGLETLARLQESNGRTKDAAETWRKIADRYDAIYEVHHFLQRQSKKGDVALGKELAELDREIFPNGRVPYVPTKEPPRAGVALSHLENVAFDRGFHRGDVVVAVEGTKVASTDQCRILLYEAKGDTMNIRVFRDGKYVDLRPSLPERLIGASFNPFPFKLR